MTYSGRNKFEFARFSSDDENHINKKLPKELLLRILSYLDVVSLCRCAQVSRLWNILALDGSNWQRIDLFDFQRDVEGPVIENISLRCGGFLRQLSLRGCESLGDDSIKSLAKSCPNIEDLNLNKCKKLSDAAVQALGRCCSKLQVINLDSCPYITDISLKALSDGCPLLVNVNVSWCQDITENGVEAIARGCPRLKSFICKGCRNVNDKAVLSLATHCPDLEVLNVQGCDSITDESISKLGGALRLLCVSGCGRLTDAALAALAARCPALATLELAQCALLTDAGFQALARVKLQDAGAHGPGGVCADNGRDARAPGDGLPAARETDAVPLRAHNGLRHQAAVTVAVRRRAPHCTRSGQLSAGDGRRAGAPRLLPQPAAHRALRLPDGHQERDTKAKEPPAQHPRSRLLRARDAARGRRRRAPALLPLLQHHLSGVAGWAHPGRALALGDEASSVI